MATLPKQLTDRPRWIVWRNEEGRKIPYSVDGYRASSTNPNHWTSYERAIEAYADDPERYAGLGFVLGDGIAGIDLDDVGRGPDMLPWAREMLSEFGTYAETSPSGQGVKLFVKTDEAEWKGKARKWDHPEGGSAEVYFGGRYFTVTGRAVDGVRELAPLPADFIRHRPDVAGAEDDGPNPPGFSRCRERILSMAPSISGQRGHDALFAVAAEITRHGFLGAVALKLISIYNEEKADPPWPVADLKRKIREAQNACMALREVGKHNGQQEDEFEDLDAKGGEAPKHYGESADGVLTRGELLTGDFTVTYLIDDVLAKGQQLILAGPPKSLKTSLLVDAALALSTGGKFLGRFQATPCRVLVITSEIGWGPLQDTVRRVCEARGIEDHGGETRDFWYNKVPNITDKKAMGRFVEILERWRPDVLGIDPAYLAMPGEGAENMMLMGQALSKLSRVCDKRGATLILAHHTKRTLTSRNGPLSLADIAWSGFAEFARQWWLLNHRDYSQGNHAMWFNFGGSAGHGGTCGLQIYEGDRNQPGGRKWVADVAESAKMDLAVDEEETIDGSESQEIDNGEDNGSD